MNNNLMLMDKTTGKKFDLPDKKKELEAVDFSKLCLVDLFTGEQVSPDLTFMFQDWMYEDYREEFHKTKQIRFLEAMSAHEFDFEEDVKLKAYAEADSTIAEQKWDGHRALKFITSVANRFFSKRVGKTTGWFSENTNTVPHLRDVNHSYDKRPHIGSVLDGEITLDVEGCTSTNVQSVTGSKPQRALKVQLEEIGFAVYNIFDILYYNFRRIENSPLWYRKLYAFKVYKSFNSQFVRFSPIYATPKVAKKLKALWDKHNKVLTPEELEELKDFIIEVKDYLKLYETMLEEEKEGLILKDITAIYEQKKSKAFIKMKEHSTFDCVITSYDDPEIWYDGKEKNNAEAVWKYWADAEDETDIVIEDMTMEEAQEEGLLPVTKFWAMDWIGAIRFSVWKRKPLQTFIDEFGNDFEMAIDQMRDEGMLRMSDEDNNYYELVEVGKCSGMDDETRKMFSENKEKYRGEVLEVMSQGFSDKKKGTLRHPRYICLRPDKNSEACTWENHIREDK